MKDDEAIAYLQQMDSEINVLLQARRGAAHLSQILQHYKTRSVELEALAKQEQTLKDNLKILEENHKTQSAAIVANLETAQKTANDALAPLHSKVADVTKSLELAENNAKDREAFFQKRSAQMDAEINEKANILKKLEEGIVEFKQRHGLA
jgi:chromosome segregation ATPase